MNKKLIKLGLVLGVVLATTFGFTGCMYVDGNDGQWHSWGPNGDNPNYTGMDSNENGWFYFENGVLNWNYNGMATLDGFNWFYFRNGVLDWGYTGLGWNMFGCWFFQNGQLAWNYTGDYGNYHIINGHLDHEHSYVTKNAKKATCSQSGYTGDKVCKHCGKVAKKGKVIAKNNKHKHTKVVNKKEATYQSEGYTGDIVCSDCGKIMKKGSSINKLCSHNWVTVPEKTHIVHHDAEYDDWDQPVYEMKSYWVCECGYRCETEEDFCKHLATHLGGSGTHRTWKEYENVQVGTTHHHDLMQPAWDETVVDSPAYTYCSKCGARQ